MHQYAFKVRYSCIHTSVASALNDVIMSTSTAQVLSLKQRGVTHIEYSSKLFSPLPLNLNSLHREETSFPLYSTQISSYSVRSLVRMGQSFPNSSKRELHVHVSHQQISINSFFLSFFPFNTKRNLKMFIYKQLLNSVITHMYRSMQLPQQCVGQSAISTLMLRAVRNTCFAF